MSRVLARLGDRAAELTDAEWLAVRLRMPHICNWRHVYRVYVCELVWGRVSIFVPILCYRLIAWFLDKTGLSRVWPGLSCWNTFCRLPWFWAATSVYLLKASFHSCCALRNRLSNRRIKNRMNLMCSALWLFPFTSWLCTVCFLRKLLA
jgi:hypothetical protein